VLHTPATCPFPRVFLLNPDNPFDVVDYWNLRAAGMILFPSHCRTTRNSSSPSEILARLLRIDQRNDYQPRGPCKARSISQEELANRGDWIRSLGFLKDFSTMGWVPRYNMNYYMIGNEIDIEPVSAYDSSPWHFRQRICFIEGPTPEFCARSTSINTVNGSSFSLSHRRCVLPATYG